MVAAVAAATPRVTPRTSRVHHHHHHRVSRSHTRQPASSLDSLIGTAERRSSHRASEASNGSPFDRHSDAAKTTEAHDAPPVPSITQEELRDQLEWDIGIAEQLYRVKAGQIKAQIAIEKRQQEQAKAVRVRACARACARARSQPQPQSQPQLQPRARARRPSLSAQTMPAPPSRASCRASRCTVGADGYDRDDGGRHSIAGAIGRGAVRRLGLGDGGGGLVDEVALAQMRTRSQRALFEGLASTAELSQDRWYVLRPHGRLRNIWTLVIEVVTVGTAILTPLASCRIVTSTLAVQAIEAVADALFLVDMFLHFITAYSDERRDIIVTSPTHIRSRYVRSWFVIDLVSVFPFSWMARAANWSGTGDGAVASPEVLRLVKLLRMYRVVYNAEGGASHVIVETDTAVSPSLVALVKVIGTLLLIWHWVACTYGYMSAREPGVDDLGLIRPGDVLLFNTTSSWMAPAHIVRGHAMVRYMHALSWAVGVTSAISSPEANTLPQLIYTLCISVVGIFVMAAIIGAASAAVSELQSQRSEAARRLQNIARYMRRKHLPWQIRRRVLSYYRFQQKSLNILEDEEMLSGLPRALRMQILIQMHQAVFVQLPLFWLCKAEELLLIVQRLRPCLASPGEMLCKEHCMGVGLFLLMKGAVETTRNEELLVVLLATAAFGEAALQVEPTASDVTVRALSFCEVSVLERRDFHDIVLLNPSIETWLTIYIIERDRRIKDPRVQAQSVQAKKATIRCGGAYREFSDLSSTEDGVDGSQKSGAKSFTSVAKITQWAATRARKTKETSLTSKLRSAPRSSSTPLPPSEPLPSSVSPPATSPPATSPPFVAMNPLPTSLAAPTDCSQPTPKPAPLNSERAERADAARFSVSRPGISTLRKERDAARACREEGDARDERIAHVAAIFSTSALGAMSRATPLASTTSTDCHFPGMSQQ
jgi:hypothetical protein